MPDMDDIFQTLGLTSDRQGVALTVTVVVVALSLLHRYLRALFQAQICPPKQPIGGPLLIEHINVCVASSEQAEAWYGTAVGAARDLRRKHSAALHLNVGPLTQFHLPSGPPEVWRGHVEVVRESHRVDSASEREKKDAWQRCPYGNQILTRRPNSWEQSRLSVRSGQRPGSEASSALGIAALYLPCRRGAAAKIASFYRRIFAFDVCVRRRSRMPVAEVDSEEPESAPLEEAVVGTACGQRLVYEETDEAFPDTSGDHVALYMQGGAAFEAAFLAAQREGLAWVNPRFPQLDGTRSCLRNARRFHQFRLREMRDEAGHLIHFQEHEVRAPGHSSCPLHPSFLAAAEEACRSRPIACGPAAHAAGRSGGALAEARWVPVCTLSDLLPPTGHQRSRRGGSSAPARGGRAQGSFLVSAASTPEWAGPEVALFGFEEAPGAGAGDQWRVHAMQNECPHVAVGSLAAGQFCDLRDVEDLDLALPAESEGAAGGDSAACTGREGAAVSCPVHAFVFDVTTGHCISHMGRNTKPGKVYSTWASPTGMVHLCSEAQQPAEQQPRFTATEGNAVQMHLVEQALGAME